MGKLTFAVVLLALAAASWAETSTPPQALHVEPLGKLDLPANKVLADTVVLQLTIDAKGGVSDAKVWTSSGDANVDAAALVAAKKCMFVPATLDGQPVESWFQIYYRLSTYKTTEYLGEDGKPVGPEKKPTAGTAATAETAAPPPAGPANDKNKDQDDRKK